MIAKTFHPPPLFGFGAGGGVTITGGGVKTGGGGGVAGAIGGGGVKGGLELSSISISSLSVVENKALGKRGWRRVGGVKPLGHILE
jgi:hypothetical protein